MRDICQAQPFRDGERVVFFGDSITQAAGYIEALQTFYATRFPERRIAFENAGIAGATLCSSLPRLQDDVLARRPSRVLLLFGSNDVSRGCYRSAAPDTAAQAQRADCIRRYASSLEIALQRCADAGVPVEVVSPPPYDEYCRTVPPGEGLIAINAGLANLVAAGKVVAAARQVPFIDVLAPLTTILAASPVLTWAPDRLHPGPSGCLLLARTILAAQGVDGPVAVLDLDYQTQRVVATAACTVASLAVDATGLSCVYAAALPFPTGPAYLDVDQAMPWGGLNQELIRVRGLPAGDWDLEIDAAVVARHAAAAFAAGVDIATSDTPQQRRAQQLRAAIAAKIAAEAPLRTIALVRAWLAEAQCDPDDAAGLEAGLAAVRAKAGPYAAFYEHSIASFLANHQRLPQVREAIAAAQTAIQALQATEGLRLRLVPAGQA